MRVRGGGWPQELRGGYVSATALPLPSCCTSLRSIDPDRLVAVCEGRVTIEQLVDAAAKHGLVPAVIPEIHDFTVAGLINGLGIETSSHRYGGFFDTVTAMEVVLASGEVRHVDLASDKDLFDTLFGSYGERATAFVQAHSASCPHLLQGQSR